MAERLLSVGLDVGTTSTQMIVSAITVENRASGFAVPEMAIADREILYRSPVHFTPLQSHNRIDGEGLRRLVEEEYRRAGITRDMVDTGAVIITGETSRKENAATVAESLSRIAGDFVVATAGPDLESVLAAKGAGAVEQSENGTVLHMDIGGGTTNMALICRGEILYTGCLNVGGRLLKLDKEGSLTYVSPVLKKLCTLSVGDKPSEDMLQNVAETLCKALEMAAGRIPETELLDGLMTREVQSAWKIPEEPVTVSFSGGVADCIETGHPPLAFGDLGVYLGKAIKNSSLCRGSYVLGDETIRATVIGAGCHSTKLSGSTVFCKGVTLPKKNLPVAVLSLEEQESPDFSAIVEAKRRLSDSPQVVLAMPGYESPDYAKVSGLAQRIAQAVGDSPLYLCLQHDMAKALGQKLSLLLGDKPCLCLDRLKLAPQSYLDIGAPVGPCFPVVIKTLVFSAD